MAKTGPITPEATGFSFTPITRSPAQGSACKDLRRNGQDRAISPEATGFSFTPITRSQGQKPACKDLRLNGQRPAITPKATYTPVSKRPCSRSLNYNPPTISQKARQLNNCLAIEIYLQSNVGTAASGAAAAPA